MNDSQLFRLPILPMVPHYRTVVWGGDRIARLKDEEPAGSTVGESWEVSDLPGEQSVVHSSMPQFAGMALSELMEKFGTELIGKRLSRIYGNRFPVLVKILDTRQPLSIQVHPDDWLARRVHGCPGKTEMWYTLEAAPDAYIYSGIRRSVTPEALRQHIAEGSVTELLARFTPVHGDMFYLPAGRIHSIGPGVLLLEIQQPSDITYRIFDYNRPGLDGKPRELHVEKALQAIDFRVHTDYMRRIEPIADREQVLKECPYFTATVLNLCDRTETLDIARGDSFRVLVATRGNGEVTDDLGNATPLRQGHTVIVPATTPFVKITPDADCHDYEVVTIYVQ